MRDVEQVSMAVGLRPLFEFACGGEAGAPELVGYAVVVAFDHSVGLRVPRPDQAVLDFVLRAHLVEDVPAGRRSVATGAAYGGGPSEASLKAIVAELKRDWADAARRLKAQSRGWSEGARALEEAAAAMLTPKLPPRAPTAPAGVA